MRDYFRIVALSLSSILLDSLATTLASFRRRTRFIVSLRSGLHSFLSSRYARYTLERNEIVTRSDRSTTDRRPHAKKIGAEATGGARVHDHSFLFSLKVLVFFFFFILGVNGGTREKGGD